MADPVKILCKGGDKLCVSIRGDKVILTREDPNDKMQQWLMDFSRARNVTDDNGGRAFALVNTKRDPGGPAFVDVPLAPYKDDGRVEISMLWSVLEKVHGDGFHQIAALRNTSEDVLDGLGVNVAEGTIVGLYASHYTKGSHTNGAYVCDNQLWKIVPVDETGVTMPI